MEVYSLYKSSSLSGAHEAVRRSQKSPVPPSSIPVPEIVAASLCVVWRSSQTEVERHWQKQSQCAWWSAACFHPYFPEFIALSSRPWAFLSMTSRSNPSSLCRIRCRSVAVPRCDQYSSMCLYLKPWFIVLVYSFAICALCSCKKNDLGTVNSPTDKLKR